MKYSKINSVDYVADERLYLSKDRLTVVSEGDPRAAFLLAAKGQTIPRKEVTRLGLDKTSKPDPKPEIEIKDRSKRIVEGDKRQ